MGLDVGSLLGGAVGRIIVRTNLAPPIVLDDPFGSAKGDGGGGLLGVIRPRIEIYDPSGALIAAVSPAGEPSDIPLVPLIAVLVGVAVVAAILITSRK